MASRCASRRRRWPRFITACSAGGPVRLHQRCRSCSARSAALGFSLDRRVCGLLRRRRDPALGDPAQDGLDRAFLTLLLRDGLTGLALLVLRQQPAMGALLHRASRRSCWRCSSRCRTASSCTASIEWRRSSWMRRSDRRAQDRSGRLEPAVTVRLKADTTIEARHAVRASSAGAPVHRSGAPGQSWPRYRPRRVPIATTIGTTMRCKGRGMNNTACVSRCRQLTWAM